jgi:MFS family permease
VPIDRSLRIVGPASGALESCGAQRIQHPARTRFVTTPQPRKASLLVIFLTVFIDLLGFGMVLPLLPIYADQFAVDPGGWQLGALMASFSVMQFFFAPLWGRLSDRVGRRPVLMIGLGGSVVFYTLFGIATVLQSYALLLASRIGAGIAGATISTSQAYIADATSLENRPKGMALIGMAFGLGFTFGPLLGYLAVPSGHGDPGPAPGYVAAALSAFALLLAIFKLPESRRPGEASAPAHVFETTALKSALATPSIALILATIFLTVFSFANFETTLSMLIKGKSHAVRSDADAPPESLTSDIQQSATFQFSWGQVCLTYAYIGLTLALVQGGIVRRLAGRIPEGALAAAGAVLQVAGFAWIVWATHQVSPPMLLAALALVVAGFGCLSPSLNSLLSRRTSPDRQGGMLGIGQSVNSLARIVGALVGIPLLKSGLTRPFLLAAVLMAATVLLILTAARVGKDYKPSADPKRRHS